MAAGRRAAQSKIARLIAAAWHLEQYTCESSRRAPAVRWQAKQDLRLSGTHSARSRATAHDAPNSPIGSLLHCGRDCVVSLLRSGGLVEHHIKGRGEDRLFSPADAHASVSLRRVDQSRLVGLWLRTPDRDRTRVAVAAARLIPPPRSRRHLAACGLLSVYLPA
eukprot:scaffold268274_cov30-Tisochrysis_lutea.AAC.2